MTENTANTPDAETTAAEKPAVEKRSRTGKFKFFIFGTAFILVAGGVGYQIYTANFADAQTAGTGPAGSTRMNKNLARVNDQFISYEDVAQESINRVGEEVLENMINRSIILQECQRQGITVTQQEVKEEVKRIADRFKMPVVTWYQMLHAERGLTQQQYDRDIIWPMLALKKLAGDNVQVTQQDLQKAFVRDYGRMVKARMIMVDNFRRAQEVHEKARRNPDSFPDLAQEYSIEPNSRALGGQIPHIRRYSGNETLENAAFKLKPGQISGILEVEHGHYVILKCEGHTEPVVNDISQVKDDLYAQVKDEKVQEAVAQVFERLRTQARVDNYLTRTSSGSNVQQTSGIRTPSSVTPSAASQPETRGR